jgi:hypothetical protein
VDATIRRSFLWENIEILQLKKNMRLESTNADAQEFANWLLDVGHGRNMVGSNNHVILPEEMRVDDVEALIESVYPGKC